MSDKCPSPLSKLGSFEDLKDFIINKNILSIEGLIACLPHSFLENYVLMHTSHSQQFASFAFPRAIIFGADAKLMISYSGDPASFGYNDLEVIQFNESEASFEFKEINFDPSAYALAKINLSPKNCVQCPRDDSRPNWNAYNDWTGAYFGRDSKIPGLSEEANAYSTFLKTNKNFGRYLSLPNQPIDGDNSSGFQDHVKEMPRMFDNDLTYLNVKRIVRKMKASDDYNSYKYAILAASLSCGYIEGFIPNELRQKDFRRPYSGYYDETQAWLKYEFNRRRAEGNSSGGGLSLTVYEIQYGNGEHGSQDTTTISNWRYLMENRGIRINDWSMNVDPNFYSFYDGSGISIEYVLPLLVENINEPDISALLPNGGRWCGPMGAANSYIHKQYTCLDESKIDRNIICDKLKTLSNGALSALLAARNVQPAKAIAKNNYPAGLESCRRCHGDAHPIAPIIPFDKPELISPMLTKIGYPHGTLADEALFRIKTTGKMRMPQDGIPLSIEQIAEIERYFLSLSSVHQ